MKDNFFQKIKIEKIYHQQTYISENIKEKLVGKTVNATHGSAYKNEDHNNC